MRSRSRRHTHVNKDKNAANQSVQDVVSDVIRNIAASEEQDADNLRSYLNSNGADIAATQPIVAATTEADELWLHKSNAAAKQSGSPPLGQTLGSDSQRSGTFLRHLFQVVANGDQADHGDASGVAQDKENEVDPSGDLWMNDGSMVELAHVTDPQTIDTRSEKMNGAGMQSPKPPLATDLQQPRALQTKSFYAQGSDDQTHGAASAATQGEERELVCFGNMRTSDPSVTEPTQGTHTETNVLRSSQRNTAERQCPTPLQENDREPVLNGLVETRRLRPSKSINYTDFDDKEETELDVEEESESDGELARHGRSQAPHLKSSNWSNEIHFDDMEEVELRDSKGKRGKKGGPILPRHVWSLRSGVRFVVPFNSLGQPVRKAGFVLIRFLGAVAKVGELCPIGAVNWTKVDKTCKAKIIALIREKFVLPDGRHIDKHILKHVGNKWRGYRHKLKLKYKKPGNTKEQVASIVPRGVIPSQWVQLVEYWFSERHQMLSKNSKVAKSAQLHAHTAGSKSFARRRDEFMKEHGREPGALEWFRKTHQRKDGTFLENASQEFVETAEALISQRGSTSSPKKRVAVENEVFNELMYSDEEKAFQRPLGYGFGVTGSVLSGVKAESRKRGYLSSGKEDKNRRFKKREFVVSTVGMDSYSPQQSSAEVEKLNSAMIAMGETNELMRGQIKMQSQQLQMQAQQLRNQSKRIEGLQSQLEQVTSLLTKFGSKLSRPKKNSMPKGVRFHGVNSSNRQAFDASSGSGGESDSSEWYSD